MGRTDKTVTGTTSDARGDTPEYSRAEKLALLRAQLKSMERRHSERERRARSRASAPSHVSASSSYFGDEGKPAKGRDGASSFESTRTQLDISWTSDTGASGTIRVPKSVARAFGSGDHSFVDVDELTEYIDALKTEACWSRLVSIVNGRERTGKELVSRLEAEGFEISTSQATVRRARECGLVDEARYAEVFITTSIRKGWGKDKIEHTLRERGADPHSVEGYPGAFFSENDEVNRAIAALSKKRVPDVNSRQKLVRFLLGRGFSMPVAIRAVDHHLEA